VRFCEDEELANKEASSSQIEYSRPYSQPEDSKRVVLPAAQNKKRTTGVATIQAKRQKQEVPNKISGIHSHFPATRLPHAAAQLVETQMSQLDGWDDYSFDFGHSQSDSQCHGIA